MTDSTNQNRKPTHTVIAALPRGEGKDDFFQRIGAGWESDKGTIWLKIELQPTDMNASIGVRPVKSGDTKA